MRFFIKFVSMIFVVLLNVNAQTTLSEVTVNGQHYDITYRSSVDFDTYETTIDDQAWWQNSGTAKSFADAANTNNLRFAFDKIQIGGTDYALYMDNANNGSQAVASSAAGNYAITAVQVPAPLPILGILPVVGFLKRMRKRQRA